MPMNRRTVLRLVPPSSGAGGAPVGGRTGEEAPASDPGLEAPPSRHVPSPPTSRGGHRALTPLDDEALVGLAASGSAAATECLYRRHAPFAINLATRLAGTSSDAEDVVHDAFLRAFQQLAGLRNPAAFRSWLGSIVVHAVRSRLRREKLRRLLGLSQGRGTQPVDIDRIASANASPAVRAELAQVYALLGTLAADDRIAWTLRNVEGHELEDAAALAGCSLATVKRRIARAQRFIDEHFVGARAASEEGES